MSLLKNLLTDTMFKMGWARLSGLARVSDEYKAATTIANMLRREVEAATAVANRLRREVDVQTTCVNQQQLTIKQSTKSIAELSATTERQRREVDVQTAAAAKLSESTDSDICLIKELTDKVKSLTHTCERYSTARHEQDATISKQHTKITNLQRVIRKVSDDIGATSAEERTV